MLILFGLVGTLFSMKAVKERFRDMGIGEDVFELWFAKLDQSIMASTLANKYAPARVIAESTLLQVFALRGIDLRSAKSVLDALSELEPRAEARACLGSLYSSGHRLAVLTNSGRNDAERLLRRWELRREFENVFSSDEVRAAKPHSAPYQMVLTRLFVGPYQCCMVSARAGDILGAEAIGMHNVYISRLERRWPLPGSPSDFMVPGLADVPDVFAKRFIAPLKAA